MKKLKESIKSRKELKIDFKKTRDQFEELLLWQLKEAFDWRVTKPDPENNMFMFFSHYQRDKWNYVRWGEIPLEYLSSIYSLTGIETDFLFNGSFIQKYREISLKLVKEMKEEFPLFVGVLQEDSKTKNIVFISENASLELLRSKEARAQIEKFMKIYLPDLSSSDHLINYHPVETFL